MKFSFLKHRYYNQLQEDIKEWVGAGWVSPQGAEQILAQQKPADSKFHFSTIIGILGAILLGFAALSFVGANWQEMSRLSRILLLFGLMWAAFGVAWGLEQKNYHGLKEAAYLLGGVLFGVNIALIAQIYHIDRHPPDGFMLWGAGMLLIAGALESRAALGATFLIIAVWTVMESEPFSGRYLRDSAHWGFLLLWVPATYLAFKLKTILSYHLSLLSMGLWLVISFFIITQDYHLSVLSGVSSLVLLMVMVALMALRYTKPQALSVSEPLPRITVLYSIMVLSLLPLLTQIVVGNGLFVYLRWSHKHSYPLWGIVLFVIPVVIAIGWLMKEHYEQKKLRLINVAFFALVASWCALFTIGHSFDWHGVVSFLANPTLFRILMLAIAIWLVNFGLEVRSAKIVNIGLFSFGVEVLYIYVKLFGSLMDTSLFFLLGGVVLIALAFGLEKMRRKLSHYQDKQLKGDGS